MGLFKSKTEKEKLLGKYSSTIISKLTDEDKRSLGKMLKSINNDLEFFYEGETALVRIKHHIICTVYVTGSTTLGDLLGYEFNTCNFDLISNIESLPNVKKCLVVKKASSNSYVSIKGSKVYLNINNASEPYDSIIDTIVGLLDLHKKELSKYKICSLIRLRFITYCSAGGGVLTFKVNSSKGNTCGFTINKSTGEFKADNLAKI